MLTGGEPEGFFRGVGNGVWPWRTSRTRTRAWSHPSVKRLENPSDNAGRDVDVGGCDMRCGVFSTSKETEAAAPPPKIMSDVQETELAKCRTGIVLRGHRVPLPGGRPIASSRCFLGGSWAARDPSIRLQLRGNHAVYMTNARSPEWVWRSWPHHHPTVSIFFFKSAVRFEVQGVSSIELCGMGGACPFQEITTC